MKRLLLIACLLPLLASAQISINESGGWFESAYATFSLTDEATSYNVYYKTIGGEYKLIDDELVRNYGTYGRADVVGITAGEYMLRIVPVDATGTELIALAVETGTLTVKAHDRGGFAHHNYSGGIGAYKDDGTLKAGARVLYITAKNAKTVSCDVITSNKGTITTCIGLQTIIDAYQKGYDTTPIAFRIIGTIEDTDMDKLSSSAEGLQIKGKNAQSTLNITIEGIGNDAAIRGFGILCRNASSVELRNFAVYLCMDDCISLDTDNSHCWVHNIDFFYGNTGGDSDQAKGDGSLDVKGDSQYMTFSYNHFWDAGKCSLCGMTSESGPNYISYHHNWFDHSDSRHPRVRTMTVHVYNNYFDGVSKYGVGATTGSSVFVESNYYRNTSHPMMISLQGTDISGDGKGTFSGEDGGMIKSYGNLFAEKSSNFKYVTYQQNSVEFDAYEATTRDEQVPSTVTAKVGGGTYNNFDTNSSLMYSYTVDAAADIPAILTGSYGAGRLQHGDFTWIFDNATEDSNYDVIADMKNAIINYQPTLVGFFTESDGTGEGGGEAGGDDGGDDDSGTGSDTPVVVPTGGYECHFTGMTPSNSFYTISGSYSDSKGTATVNGITYSECLKIESKTSISFTIGEEMTLTLVFADGTVPNIKIDGEKVSATGNNVITATVAAGTHTITKADTYNLFYINLTGASSAIKSPKVDTDNEPIYDTMGRIVSEPIPGKVYIRNGRKFIAR